MIEGTLVNLEALEGDFTEKLKAWINTPAWYAANRHERREAILPQRVEKLIVKWEKDEKIERMGIRTRGENPQMIGLTGWNKGFFQARTLSMTLWFMIADPAFSDSIEALDAMLITVGLLFDTYNNNRVEYRVPAYDEGGIALARRCGFVEEGRFREAMYADGAVHDVLLFGLLRAEWRGYKTLAAEQLGKAS